MIRHLTITCAIVSKGIYQFSYISSDVKQKWENDIDLTEDEVQQLISDNPQATGISGRVMTQLRAMKDQGFLIFDNVSSNHPKVTISELGWELINGKIDAATIYTKAMIMLQANSPARAKIYNESRPFMNTLFVIKEVNRMWEAMGHEGKGIHPHEFSTFVLSMKDCNYLQAAKDIIEYRKKYKHEINYAYLARYLKARNILPINENSLRRDYPDDVFRKFEMTGLIVKRGKFSYIYYDFSRYNRGKIDEIMEAFKDYKFIEYSSQDEYYKAMYSVNIPWEKDMTLKKNIIEVKAAVLGITLNPSLSYEENELMLDRIFSTQALNKAIDNVSMEKINKELLILSGKVKAKSEYDDISESLRLEYLLALALGKRYGTDGLISNILYNEDGRPLHCAAAGKCDIMYYTNDGAYILEPTMLSGRDQQSNSETTNVARHAREEEQKLKIGFRVVMVAPRVHADVADFFRYKVITDNARLMPLSIERTVGLINESETITILNANYDQLIKLLKEAQCNVFADTINKYSFSLTN